MNFSKVIASILLSIWGEFAAAGNEHGNGGNPRRLVEREAQKIAALSVSSADLAETYRTANSWLIEHRDALAAELKNSRVLFVDKLPEFCEKDWTACSMREKSAPIYIDRNKTAAIQNPTLLAQLIIHEAVHHFGIEDEALADGIALAAVQNNLSGLYIQKEAIDESRISPKASVSAGRGFFPNDRHGMLGSVRAGVSFGGDTISARYTNGDVMGTRYVSAGLFYAIPLYVAQFSRLLIEAGPTFDKATNSQYGEARATSGEAGIKLALPRLNGRLELEFGYAAAWAISDHELEQARRDPASPTAVFQSGNASPYMMLKSRSVIEAGLSLNF